MPAPSQLAIATSALNRLVKEEASYHKELAGQRNRISKLEQGENADDENAEYVLRQECKALEETKTVIPEIRKKIQDAQAKVEKQMNESDAAAEEVAKAKEAISASKQVVQKTM